MEDIGLLVVVLDDSVPCYHVLINPMWWIEDQFLVTDRQSDGIREKWIWTTGSSDDVGVYAAMLGVCR